MSQIDYLEAYHLAIELVKKAGFEFGHASMSTESCYYFHPARRPYLLRISAHKSKQSPIGMNNVIARVSFTRGEDKHGIHTEKNTLNRITWAIGQYFLNEPKPSRYLGKRGTWENDTTVNL